MGEKNAHYYMISYGENLTEDSRGRKNKKQNKTRICRIVIDNMYYYDQRNGTALARLIRKRQVMNYA